MKKALSLFLILVMMLSLCSCADLGDMVKGVFSKNSSYSANKKSGAKQEDKKDSKSDLTLHLEYFDMTLPEEYAGNYTYKETTENLYDGVYCVSFYEKRNHDLTGAGHVFTVNFVEDSDYQLYVPGGIFGEIKVGKTTYYLLAVFPSDVQFELEYRGYYNALYYKRIDALYSISSKENKIKLYDSFREKYDKNVVEDNQPTQVVTVNSSGSDATLTLYEITGTKTDILFECKAKVGSDGVSYETNEQAKATPEGWFNILFAFSNKNVDTLLKFKSVTKDTVWIDDPDSAYYNTWQNRSASYADWSSYEDIYEQFSGGNSSCCIAFNFNGDCENRGSATKGRGSAIFIDGKSGKLTATYGDIAITSGDMEKLVSYLDSSKNPMLVIR